MKRVVSLIIVFIFSFLFMLELCASEIEKVEFSKCVDGDTIKVLVNGEEKTVRFLAIDTPETKHPEKGVEPWGKTASNFTCNAVKKAKELELEYDPGSEKTDKYDRLLAWIRVDGILLQDELLRNGYAKIEYLYGDYLYTDELKSIELNAKNQKLGIWSDEEEFTWWEKIINFIIDLLKAIINFLIDSVLKAIFG